jgi:hypothetical protein
VPQSDVAAFDHVMIQCPACGASEAADPAVLADAPMIVCRECGETWPVSPRRRARRAPAPEDGASSHVIDAERRPLIAFSSGVGQAWAAKMEGDVLPAPPKHSRVPLIAAGLVSALFLATFLAGRQAAVAALPDLAGLYAAFGLSVNLDGVVIEAVEAERTAVGGVPQLIVQGGIRNVSGTAQPVPPLTLSFRDRAGKPAGWRGFDPPPQLIAAGEAAPFRLAVKDVPRQAADVVVRFRRPAERVPEESEGGIAAP